MNKKRFFFHSKTDLEDCIHGYFKHIEGDFQLSKIPSKLKGSSGEIEQKIWIREPEPPTISGLAFYLGFESRQAFDQYELSGKHGPVLKRGRLQIEAEYEKKLHFQSSAGAIFALKAMGWTDKAEVIPVFSGTIKVEIIDTGIKPAASEKEVDLS